MVVLEGRRPSFITEAAGVQSSPACCSKLASVYKKGHVLTARQASRAAPECTLRGVREMSQGLTSTLGFTLVPGEAPLL